MRVAEARDGDAGVQIEIGVAVTVDERRSVPALDRQLREERNRLQPRRDEPLLIVKQRFGSRSKGDRSSNQHRGASQGSRQWPWTRGRGTARTTANRSDQ